MVHCTPKSKYSCPCSLFSKLVWAWWAQLLRLRGASDQKLKISMLMYLFPSSILQILKSFWVVVASPMKVMRFKNLFWKKIIASHNLFAISNKKLTAEFSISLLQLKSFQVTDLGSLIGTTQCEKFWIFLPLRFYVKSILVILKP